MFADYFASIFTAEPNDNFEKLPQLLSTNALPKLSITEDVVFRKLSEINISKSPGPDDIHPKILFEARSSITSYVTQLFNSSLSDGSVPADWKFSTTSVLHKKDRKDCVENYQPISLTCILCKILESIVHDHIMNFMLSNKAFSNTQYGFITKRSVMLQLLKIVDHWTRLLDQSNQVDIYIYIQTLRRRLTKYHTDAC